MSKLIKAFLFASLLVSSFAVKAVTVASWGGAYTESQQKAYADTYSDPSSIQFENYNGGLGEVRAQVESGNVTWDLVDVLPSDAITGCDEGLFEDITSEIADSEHSIILNQVENGVAVRMAIIYLLAGSVNRT